MGMGPSGRDTTSRRADNETKLQKERLVSVFNRVGFFPDALGERRQPDRKSFESPTQRVQDCPVHFVKT